MQEMHQVTDRVERPNPANDGPQPIEQLRSDLAEQVAELVEQLPEGADLIERAIADGDGTDELNKLLDSLPGTDDLADLEALIHDPDELPYLLAEREAEAALRQDGDES